MFLNQVSPSPTVAAVVITATPVSLEVVAQHPWVVGVVCGIVISALILGCETYMVILRLHDYYLLLYLNILILIT